MLSIPRSVARLVRATFRKAGDTESKAKSTVVTFRSDATGLRIQSRAGAVSIEYRVDGAFPPSSFVLPFAALADFESTATTAVQLAIEPSDTVRAEWADAGVPQRRHYAMCKDDGRWLVSPTEFRSVGDGSTLAAITEAMHSAAQQRIRFALSCVQLRGKKGDVVGTDGHQLLIVRGFNFPWEDDVLVPRTRLFEAKVFTDAAEVEMARTDDHVVVRAGSWTAWLTIDKAGRFPDVDQVIPRAANGSTRIVLANEDAEFLIRSLPRLPSDGDENKSVTVHANGQVVIRAKSESAPLTELVLSRSRVIGDEVKINVHRDHFRRAAQLGIREFRFVNDRSPIVGQSDKKTFVWHPLASKHTLGPSEDAFRIESVASVTTCSNPQPIPRIDPPMNDKPNTNRTDEHEIETTDDVIVDPIQEADVIRTQLRETLGRVNRLVHALKRQRRQAQLVRSTLASLKQLQDVA